MTTNNAAKLEAEYDRIASLPAETVSWPVANQPMSTKDLFFLSAAVERMLAIKERESRGKEFYEGWNAAIQAVRQAAKEQA